jgi:hypothetical protein
MKESSKGERAGEVMEGGTDTKTNTKAMREIVPPLLSWTFLFPFSFPHAYIPDMNSSEGETVMNHSHSSLHNHAFVLCGFSCFLFLLVVSLFSVSCPAFVSPDRVLLANHFCHVTSFVWGLTFRDELRMAAEADPCYRERCSR